MGYGGQNEHCRTGNCGKNAAERNNPTGEDECGGIRVMSKGGKTNATEQITAGMQWLIYIRAA